MRGAVETLMNMDLAKGDAAAPKFLDMIKRHNTRLETLATDLLALSHVEAGSRRFQASSLALADFLKELNERWRDAIERKQIVWSVAAPPDCHSLNANAHLLNLVLDNLIENAIKFTPTGGRVSITFEREGAAMAVRVADSGCGIAPEEQSRVFERFYQASDTRTASATSSGGAVRGTGLGLSIVRHAVKAMKGSVSLESALGEGTTVTVRIPQ